MTIVGNKAVNACIESTVDKLVIVRVGCNKISPERRIFRNSLFRSFSFSIL